MDHNAFSGEFPANLTACVRLTTVYLQYNQLGGRIPVSLATH
jgi:hypothetical protein